MNKDLRKLYPDLIKAHNQVPYHFEKRERADDVVSAYNPICGDRFDVYVDWDSKNTIGQIHFAGLGCSVSKASTSILTKLLEGKTVEEALVLCTHFLSYLHKESGYDGLVLPEEFFSFSGVHDFPERLECAGLAWKEMKEFLLTKNKE